MLATRRHESQSDCRRLGDEHVVESLSWSDRGVGVIATRIDQAGCSELANHLDLVHGVEIAGHHGRASITDQRNHTTSLSYPLVGIVRRKVRVDRSKHLAVSTRVSVAAIAPVPMRPRRLTWRDRDGDELVTACDETIASPPHATTRAASRGSAFKSTPPSIPVVGQGVSLAPAISCTADIGCVADITSPRTSMFGR